MLKIHTFRRNTSWKWSSAIVSQTLEIRDKLDSDPIDTYGAL